MRSEIVWLSSTIVMSTLVDCICGVWNLRSLSSASTRDAVSRELQSMSNCEMSFPVFLPLASVCSMLGVKYSIECWRRKFLSGLSLFGVPACLPPSRPRPSPFCLGIVLFFVGCTFFVADTKLNVWVRIYGIIFVAVEYVVFNVKLLILCLVV